MQISQICILYAYAKQSGQYTSSTLYMYTGTGHIITYMHDY